MPKQPRVRRACSAEFELEAVRRLAEQRARGVSVTQVGRDSACARICCVCGRNG